MTRLPFVALAMLPMMLASVQPGQRRESTTCETNIVFATVLATYCSHASDNEDVVDLMILWRGQPGWFQRHGAGPIGGGGSHTIGATNGRVSEYRMYNGVTIRYDADFDAGTVTISGLAAPIGLEKVNAVLVDGVDQSTGAHLRGTLRIAPSVTFGGDHNLKVIQSSRTLVAFLQCGIPMPASRGPVPQPVITVCEKLASGR
jgi:hypothetical protein